MDYTVTTQEISIETNSNTVKIPAESMQQSATGQM